MSARCGFIFKSATSFNRLKWYWIYARYIQGHIVSHPLTEVKRVQLKEFGYSLCGSFQERLSRESLPKKAQVNQTSPSFPPFLRDCGASHFPCIPFQGLSKLSPNSWNKPPLSRHCYIYPREQGEWKWKRLNVLTYSRLVFIWKRDK